MDEIDRFQTETEVKPRRKNLYPTCQRCGMYCYCGDTCPRCGGKVI